MSRLTTSPDGAPLSTFIAANAWTFGLLLKVRSIADSGTTEDTFDNILSDDNDNWGIGLSTGFGGNRIIHWFNDGSIHRRTLRFTLNQFYFFHGRYSGGRLELGKNGMFGIALTGLGSVASLTGKMISGYPWTFGGFAIDAELLVQFVKDTALTNAEIESIRQEMQSVFSLTLAPDGDDLSALWPRYTDQHFDRRRKYAERLAEARNYPTPIIAAQLTPMPPPVFPDRTLRSPPRLQENVGVIRPERTSPLASVDFPERIVRTRVPAAAQPSGLAVYPFPERKVVYSEAIAPERVIRASRFAVSQQVTGFAPSPERTSTLADIEFPDRVPRPIFHAAQQHHVSEIPPNPERTSTLAGVDAPDRIVRPLFHPSMQQGFFPSMYPERASPLARAEYSDRVVRSFMHPSQQLATVTSLQPERTSPLTSVDFPDRVFRPAFLVALQQHVTTLSPQPEEMSPHDWSTAFPDRIDRPTFHPSRQQFFAMPSQPERQVIFADAVYPERIPRRWAPHGDLVQSPPANFVRTLLDSFTSYPDRIPRPVTPPAHQQYFAANTFPISTPVLTLLNTGWVISPDRVPRPVFLTASQQASPSIMPRPERTSPLACVSFPDWAARRLFLPALQQATSALAPLPERKAPLAHVEAPVAVYRLSMRPALQQVMALAPRPEGSVPYTSVEAPPFVVRPRFLAFLQQSVLSVHPRPEQTSPLTWALFVDRPPARTVHAQAEIAEPFITAVAPQPVRNFLPIYPDRVTRPFVPPAHQQVLGIPTLPIPNPPIFVSPRGATGSLELVQAADESAPAVVQAHAGGAIKVTIKGGGELDSGDSHAGGGIKQTGGAGGGLTPRTGAGKGKV